MRTLGAMSVKNYLCSYAAIESIGIYAYPPSNL